MKVCVFGAGAVGGHVATRLLAAHAEEISVVARDATLEAVREHGFTLRTGGKELTAKPAIATDDPSTLPPQDAVIVTLKAHAIPDLAAPIARLIAPGGCAVFLLNGIPWWWKYGLPGAPATLRLLDPEDALWTQVRPERTFGCVVYSSNETIAPGVIEHTGRNHLILGEPDGTSSTRLIDVVELFRRVGFEASVSDDLRREIWRKLLRNSFGNTLTALTRTDLGGVCADTELRKLSIAFIREVLACAAATGWDLRKETDVEALARHGKPGQRPSMLQDVLRGRPIEVEAQLGQIQAFAREMAVAVPTIDVLLPLLRGLYRSLRGD